MNEEHHSLATLLSNFLGWAVILVTLIFILAS